MPIQQLVWDGTSHSRQDNTVYRAPDGHDWEEITRQLQSCQTSVYQSWTQPAGQNLLAGQPIYWLNDKIWPAQATDVSLAEVMAFVQKTTPENELAPLVTSGQLSLDNWTAITGNVHLQTGSTYFLSLTAGMISISAPNMAGQVVVELGKALGPTTLDIRIRPPMEL